MIDAAVVGLGWWGKVLVDAAHHSGSGIRFVVGATRHPQRVAEWAARRGMRSVGSLPEVLEDPAVRAVVLATPHSQHVEQVVACADAGRSVFCEKPLALDLADARRAADACTPTAWSSASAWTSGSCR